MSLWRIEELLTEAETALRQDLTQAAADNDYDTVQVLAAFGQQLGRVLASVRSRVEADGLPLVGRSPVAQVAPRHWDYPRFSIVDWRLRKVGRSKQPNSPEYVHEMTKEQFLVVTGWFDSFLSTERTQFSALEIEKALTPGLPSYLVYLAVAALRQARIITQVVRGRYELGPNVNQPPSAWWDLLVQRLSPAEGVMDEDTSRVSPQTNA